MTPRLDRPATAIGDASRLRISLLQNDAVYDLFDLTTEERAVVEGYLDVF